MIPFSYSIRSLKRRPLTISVTLVGLALVVFVFAAVLMLQQGIKDALVHNGSPENVLFLREGATSELVGILSRDQLRLLAAEPEIALGSDGKPLVSGEFVAIAALDRVEGTGAANVQLRGTSEESLALRSNVHIVRGRLPTPGTSEVMVGVAASGKYKGAEMGQSITMARREWPVVGVFSADGAAFESEVWGDALQLMDAFGRPVYSDAVARLKSPNLFSVMAAKLAADPQLSTINLWREDRFFDSQSEALRTFIGFLGIFVASIFALAAAFGAAVTMYAQVAGRVREVGTLRAIGFRRRTVLAVFLRETLLISVAAAVLGTVAALLLTLVSFTTLNNNTFSEVTFHFHFGPQVGLWALIFSLIMGLLGGFTPALRAARLPIVAAVRGGR